MRMCGSGCELPRAQDLLHGSFVGGDCLCGFMVPEKSSFCEVMDALEAHWLDRPGASLGVAAPMDGAEVGLPVIAEAAPHASEPDMVGGRFFER